VRFAVRQFAKAPGFTGIALVTLALGIGANTAIFSVVHKLLLAPLPYPNGSRIVIPMQQGPDETSSVDLAVIQAWRSSAHSVDMVASAAQGGLFSVGGDGSVVAVPNGWMTANYLQTLGVRPVVGRAFSSEEENAEQPNVAMISYGLWQREHGGDARAIGTTIRFNKRSYTIVGVTPADLIVPLASNAPPDIWLPRSIDRLDKGAGGPARIFARLRDDVSLDAASRELQTIASRVPTDAKDRLPVRLMRVQDFLDPREVRSVQVLFVAVGVLLLIACANVANLLLARAWTRRREFAIRTALGAGRARLARQVLTESVLLAGAGAVLGIAVAWGALRVIIALRPPELDHLASVRIEPVVLFWSLGVAIATGLLFGCAPAIVAGARKVGDVLRTDTRSATSHVVSRRVRSSLVVFEIATSLVLLVGAGLLARSFLELQRVRLGFEPNGLATVSAMINAPPTSGRHAAIRTRALERARSVPGVVDAAMGSMPAGDGPDVTLEAEPDASGRALRAERVITNEISADYFRVARIGMVEGRAPDSAAAPAAWKAGNDWGTSGEVVVNRALAQRLWPNGRVIGSRVKPVPGGHISQAERWSTVVGVVDDIRAPGDRRAMPALQMYSLLPPGFPINSFAVRTTGPAEANVSALERTMRSVDADLLVWRATAGEAYVRNGRAPARFAMTLLVAFAVVAVTLAAAGLYGVIHYGVNQRTREIGVRVALGASSRAITQLVLGSGLTLALVGVALGTLAAAATTRLLASMLYGVRPVDPLTFAAIAALVATIAVVASYIPARRALRVSPTEALRAD
jgi:putative ABC transport system permease protein